MRALSASTFSPSKTGTGVCSSARACRNPSHRSSLAERHAGTPRRTLLLAARTPTVVLHPVRRVRNQPFKDDARSLILRRLVSWWMGSDTPTQLHQLFTY